jgi:hypothetical protein
MAPTSATVACILDTELSSTMIRDQCYADTKFCFTLRSAQTWYYFLCSRKDNERVQENSGTDSGTTPDPVDPANSDKSGESTETEEPVLVSKAEARMMLDDDIKSFPIVDSTTEEGLKFKATIEKLFSAGKIVLGAKYNSDTGIRTASFNGYIRELRIWSKAIDTGFANYIKRERLDPMAYGALTGYWPLFGGSLDNFAELSAHNIETTIKGMSVDKRSGGASEWIQTPNLPSFPYCYKGYVYQPKTGTCVLRKTHTGLYINVTNSDKSKPCECTVAKSNKKAGGDGITLSIWIYLREKITQESVLFGVDDYAKIAGDSSNNLVGLMRKTAEEWELNKIATDYAPDTGKWIHYALAVSNKLKEAFLVYDGKTKNEIAEKYTMLDNDFSTFTIGLKIVGFIREAKIWNTSLVVKNTGTSAYDYSALNLEKF